MVIMFMLISVLTGNVLLHEVQAQRAANTTNSASPIHNRILCYNVYTHVPLPCYWTFAVKNHNANIFGQRGDDNLLVNDFVKPTAVCPGTITSLQLQLLQDNLHVASHANYPPGGYAYAGDRNGIGAAITSNHIGTNNEQIKVHYYAGATQGVHYTVVYTILGACGSVPGLFPSAPPV